VVYALGPGSVVVSVPDPAGWVVFGVQEKCHTLPSASVWVFTRPSDQNVSWAEECPVVGVMAFSLPVVES